MKRSSCHDKRDGRPDWRAHEVALAFPGLKVEIEPEGIAGLHRAVYRRGLEAEGVPTGKQGNTSSGYGSENARAHDLQPSE
jgi:hypothetical protein